MLPGDNIGRYRVVSKIGEGGMGEVHLAEDVKLGRRVALKILPAKVADDPDRIVRFEQEAKSASGLNHPNIITIYEIDDEGGSLYIAMEYVEGRTLGKLIRNRELDLRTSLDISIQTVSALAAAHDANVTHRDIKPDNIIIRPDGLVKVLDFGLAKLTEQQTNQDLAALSTLFKTSPGLVMGTVGYMSPEQARGREVDGRSDIFSFGSILYEMLSGKRPFTGENEVDIIASILHKEPEPLGDGIPDELKSLVRKTLRKDREERYQTATELLADLRDLRQKLTGEMSGSSTADFQYAAATGDGFSKPLSTDGYSKAPTSSISGAIAAKARLHPVIAAGLVLAAAVGLGFLATNLYQSWQRTESFQNMRFAKLTSSGNIVSEQSAVSPDGKYIAYVTQDGGNQGLWVKQTAASASVQVVPPAEVMYDGLTFSPDGVQVYYTMFEKTSGQSALYQVPVLGGMPRKLISDVFGPVSLLPDGSRIAFIRKETSILTAKPDGSDEQVVATSAEGNRYFRLAWSPDSKKIMAAMFSATDSRDHIVEIGAKDGSEKPFSSIWLRVRSMAWLPEGDGLVVSGRDPETQLSQLWLVNYPDAEAKRITNDLNNYQGVSISADGKTIVSVQENRLSNIWLAENGDPSSARKITTELGRDEGLSGVALVPDGRVVYTVRLRGQQDLWIVNPDGSGNRQLTFDSRDNFSPAVTPDGRYIVFVSTRSGTPDIWRMDIVGGNPVRLTAEPGLKGEPNISPDGKWVVYQLVNEKNQSSVWKVSIDGGTPTPVVQAIARRPIVSPDGKFIACEYNAPEKAPPFKFAVASVDGSLPAREIDLPAVIKSRTFRWSPDGKSVVYFESRDRVYNLWRQSLDGGAPIQLTNFSADKIFRFDISREGTKFAFARGSETSDVIMVSDFR